jgi:hypothetical protein
MMSGLRAARNKLVAFSFSSLPETRGESAARPGWALKYLRRLQVGGDGPRCPCKLPLAGQSVMFLLLLGGRISASRDGILRLRQSPRADSTRTSRLRMPALLSCGESEVRQGICLSPVLLGILAAYRCKAGRLRVLLGGKRIKSTLF